MSKRYYDHSFIVASGCHFIDALSMGWGCGGGGGIMAEHSILMLSESSFENCIALFGGGVCARGSEVVMNGVQYMKCSAWYTGGGFYALNTVEESECTLAMSQTKFTQCSAREFAGALYLGYLKDTSIDKCEFNSCHSGSSGGAVTAISSLTRFFSCKFFNNMCGDRNTNEHSGEQSLNWSPEGDVTIADFAVRKRNYPRGGGAILFILDGNDNDEQVDVLTQDCCFYGNKCKQPDSVTGSVATDPGFDVLVAANDDRAVNYMSYNDRFILSRELAIGVSAKNPVVQSYYTIHGDGLASRYNRNIDHPCHDASISDVTLPVIVHEQAVEETAPANGDSFANINDVSKPQNTKPAWDLPDATIAVRPGNKPAMPTLFKIPDPATATPQFTASSGFTASSVFTETHAFSQSKPFTRSNLLPSRTFTESAVFTPSTTFHASSEFSASRMLTASYEFGYVPTSIAESSVATTASTGSTEMNEQQEGRIHMSWGLIGGIIACGIVLACIATLLVMAFSYFRKAKRRVSNETSDGMDFENETTFGAKVSLTQLPEVTMGELSSDDFCITDDDYE